MFKETKQPGCMYEVDTCSNCRGCCDHDEDKTPMQLHLDKEQEQQAPKILEEQKRLTQAIEPAVPLIKNGMLNVEGHTIMDALSAFTWEESIELDFKKELPKVPQDTDATSRCVMVSLGKVWHDVRVIVRCDGEWRVTTVSEHTKRLNALENAMHASSEDDSIADICKSAEEILLDSDKVDEFINKWLSGSL